MAGPTVLLPAAAITEVEFVVLFHCYKLHLFVWPLKASLMTDSHTKQSSQTAQCKKIMTRWTFMQGVCVGVCVTNEQKTKALKKGQQHGRTDGSAAVRLSFTNRKSSAADTHSHSCSALHSVHTTWQSSVTIFWRHISYRKFSISIILNQ